MSRPAIGKACEKRATDYKVVLDKLDHSALLMVSSYAGCPRIFSHVYEDRLDNALLMSRLDKCFDKLFSLHLIDDYAKLIGQLTQGLSRYALSQSSLLKAGRDLLHSTEDLECANADGTCDDEKTLYRAKALILSVLTAIKPLDMDRKKFQRFIKACKWFALDKKWSRSQWQRFRRVWLSSADNYSHAKYKGVLRIDNVKSRDFYVDSTASGELDHGLMSYQALFAPFFDFTNEGRTDSCGLSRFENSVICQARMQGLQFMDLRITGSQAFSFNLSHVEVEDRLAIENTDMSYATFNGLSARTARLTNVTCVGAAFKGSKIEYGVMKDVDFSFADLTDVTWDKLRYSNITVTGARLSLALLSDLIEQDAIDLNRVDWAIQDEAVRNYRKDLETSGVVKTY